MKLALNKHSKFLPNVILKKSGPLHISYLELDQMTKRKYENTVKKLRFISTAE